MDIRNELEQLRDEKYREFGLSLLPNVDKSKMIGVRPPPARKERRAPATAESGRGADKKRKPQGRYARSPAGRYV